jgi:hypothetical protein
MSAVSDRLGPHGAEVVAQIIVNVERRIAAREHEEDRATEVTRPTANDDSAPTPRQGGRRGQR